jgi:lauroyl/myristoyl acyltransferase
VAAGLARARRLVQPPCRPPASLAVRLRTTPWLRSVLPARLAVARAVRRGETIWKEDHKQRESARAAVTAMVAGTTRNGEIETLARLHVIENETREAFYWRRWSKPEIDATSTARLREALGSERGVLISACHLGPIFYPMGLITSLGATPYAVAAPWLFDTPSPDPWGQHLYRWRMGIAQRRERLVCSVGSFPVLKALLEQREIVYLLFDMPGSCPTRFLGKQVMLATGSSRLAVEADAVALPIRARREGHRVWTDVSEPLDPRDFAGTEELHRALAAVHERWILEEPATLEDPRRPGAWEQGARPDAWVRPESSRVASIAPGAIDPHTDSLA